MHFNWFKGHQLIFILLLFLRTYEKIPFESVLIASEDNVTSLINCHRNAMEFKSNFVPL